MASIEFAFEHDDTVKDSITGLVGRVTQVKVDSTGAKHYYIETKVTARWIDGGRLEAVEEQQSVRDVFKSK